MSDRNFKVNPGKMFSTNHNECVGFESRWKVKKVSAVETIQTSEFSSKDVETSTSESQHVEVQTEPIPIPPSSEVDEEKLAEWLKRIYPSVKKELDDGATSRAFKGYKLVNDPSDVNCKLVQTIDMAGHLKDSTIGCQVAALAWNSTNQTLAISCTYKHNSWCYHEGIVLFYTLDTNDNIPEVPKLKLTTEGCVSCLEFHSTLPAIIAAGLISGAILIWNIQKDDDQLVVKVDGHSDNVTQLAWINDINTTRVILASSSLDTHLFLWDFHINDSHLKLREKHQIRTQMFPKSTPTDNIKKITRGITCFDFSKFLPEIFIVAAEGGLVVQCSLIGSNKLKSDKVPLVDSTFKYYQPHNGEINSISFSPNRKDMFLTNGTDNEIRIYIIDQEEPAQVIFLKNVLNSVTWIPFEERLVCGVGRNGLLEIFRLLEGGPVENVIVEKVKAKELTEIKINKIKNGIVAVGTINGLIQMWRVPWVSLGNSSSV